MILYHDSAKYWSMAYIVVLVAEAMHPACIQVLDVQPLLGFDQITPFSGNRHDRFKVSVESTHFCQYRACLNLNTVLHVSLVLL